MKELGGDSMFQHFVNWIFVWLDEYQRKKSGVQSSSCVQMGGRNCSHKRGGHCKAGVSEMSSGRLGRILG